MSDNKHGPPEAQAVPLRTKVFRGSVIMLGTTVALRVISILSSIVVARLLDPVQFGIVALASVVLQFVELFAPLGLPAALIQRQTDKLRAAYQVFVVSIGTAVVAYLGILAARGVLADWLGNRDLAAVLPWMGLMVLLGGLTRVPEALVEKELAFGRLSRIMIAGDIVYIATTLIAAFSGAGLWSLVMGSLFRATVTLVMSWWLCPSLDWLRPQPWNTGLMRELLRYGLLSVVSRSVNYVFTNADNLVVGRELGATALGYYSKAFDFTTRTVENINRTIGVVLFPSYSSIQGNRERLANAYVKSYQMIGSVTMPMAMGIFATANELVPLILGEKWRPMSPILQILALMSLVKPLSSTSGALFGAMGYPRYNVRAGLVVVGVLLPLMVVLLPFGAEGIAGAVFLAHVIGFAYNIYQIHTLLPGTAQRMMRASLPTLGAITVMTAGIYLLKFILGSLIGQTEHVVTLTGCIIGGGAIYTGMVYLTQRDLITEVRSLLRRRKAATPA